MVFRFHALLFIALITLWSCSHKTQVVSQKSLGPDEGAEAFDRQLMQQTSLHLEEKVIKVKNDKVASDFLATDLFLKGNHALIEGDFGTASVYFKHLSILVPDDLFIKKKYAISLIRVGNLEESQTVLEDLFAKSKEEKVGLILGGVYTGLDKEKKARAIYSKILVTNPKSEDACIFLGKSFALAKETAKALVILSGCANKDPKNGMYDYYMGKVHIEMGHMEKAIASFNKSLKRQPGLNSSVIALGMIHEERENFLAAIKLYRDYLKTHPGDQSVLSRVVNIMFMKEQYHEVIHYAERLIDLEPENLNLKVKLGILYTDAKKYPEALSIFKDLLVSAPQSDKILYYMGAIHQEMKDFEKSIEYFNEIPVNSGLYTDSSVQVANMLSLLAQEDKDKWHDSFISHVDKKAIEFKDLKVEFKVIKSGYFESVGLYKDAMEAMVEVKDAPSFSSQHKFYLANLFEREKKFEESTSLILGIIEKEPKNAHAWNFLGYAMLERGTEVDKAYEYIQTALKISPDDGYIRDSLGWYYFKKGDMKRALTELQVAFKKVPDDIEILKHLAHIHKVMKDFNKARAFLESALKHVRYVSDRQEIMNSIQMIENDRLPASKKMD